MSIQRLVSTIEECEPAELDYGTVHTLGVIRHTADKQDKQIADLQARVAELEDAVDHERKMKSDNYQHGVKLKAQIVEQREQLAESETVLKILGDRVQRGFKTLERPSVQQVIDKARAQAKVKQEHVYGDSRIVRGETNGQ